jgi:hypothetical protein
MMYTDNHLLILNKYFNCESNLIPRCQQVSVLDFAKKKEEKFTKLVIRLYHWFIRQWNFLFCRKEKESENTRDTDLVQALFTAVRLTNQEKMIEEW